MKDTKASIFLTHCIQLTAPFYSPSYASSDGPSFWRKPKAPFKWNSPFFGRYSQHYLPCLCPEERSTEPFSGSRFYLQFLQVTCHPCSRHAYWCPQHAICHPQAAAGMRLISELLIDKMCQWFLLPHSLPSVLWRKARYLKTWAFLLVLIWEGIYLEWSCISSKGQVFFCPWTLDSHSYPNLSP